MDIKNVLGLKRIYGDEKGVTDTGLPDCISFCNIKHKLNNRPRKVRRKPNTKKTNTNKDKNHLNIRRNLNKYQKKEDKVFM